MKLKKLLSGILASTLIVSMLASCGGNKDSENGKEVSIDAGAGKDAAKMDMWLFSDIHAQFYEDMLKRWNQDHADKQIDIKVSVMPFDDMHNKLTLALQSGEGAPDLVDVEINKFPNYLQGEVQFMDLTSYVDPYREDILASRLEVYSKDGKNYGIPTHVGASVAFYDTKILEEANVDYKTIKTWDDYKEAGLKVVKTGKIMGAAETGNMFIYESMLAAQGADRTDEKGKPTLDTPESIKAFKTIQDLVKAGVDKTIPGGQVDCEEGYGALNEGNYACVIRPLWYMSRYTNYMDNIESGRIAIAPYPVFDESKFGTSHGGGGTGTVVTKQSENPELAAEWLCWAKLSKIGNEQIWNVLGFDPCNTSLWNDKELTTNKDNIFIKHFANNPFDVLNDIKDNFVTIKTTSCIPTVNDILSTVTLNDLIENGVDPTEAAKSAQEQAMNELG